MINVVKAERAYLNLKRAGWVGTGSLLAVLGLPLLLVAMGFPPRLDARWAILIENYLWILFMFCVVATVYYIALTASYLGRSHLVWFLGCIVVGPLSLVIAYYRLRVLLAQNGLLK